MLDKQRGMQNRAQLVEVPDSEWKQNEMYKISFRPNYTLPQIILFFSNY